MIWRNESLACETICTDGALAFKMIWRKASLPLVNEDPFLQIAPNAGDPLLQIISNARDPFLQIVLKMFL
jgi:hypothetical protein